MQQKERLLNRIKNDLDLQELILDYWILDKNLDKGRDNIMAKLSDFGIFIDKKNRGKNPGFILKDSSGDKVYAKLEYYIKNVPSYLFVNKVLYYSAIGPQTFVIKKSNNKDVICLSRDIEYTRGNSERKFEEGDGNSTCKTLEENKNNLQIKEQIKVFEFIKSILNIDDCEIRNGRSCFVNNVVILKKDDNFSLRVFDYTLADCNDKKQTKTDHNGNFIDIEDIKKQSKIDYEGRFVNKLARREISVDQKGGIVEILKKSLLEAVDEYCKIDKIQDTEKKQYLGLIAEDIKNNISINKITNIDDLDHLENINKLIDRYNYGLKVIQSEKKLNLASKGF